MSGSAHAASVHTNGSTSALDVESGRGFDAALAGRATALLDSDGRTSGLEARRWRGPADADDAWLLDRCTGPTVDLGCGPGRLLVALARRGVAALGVDHSPVAAAHCRRRGVAMLQRDVFAPVPGEGGWRHVLLVDGNVGIGGDPVELLARAARILAPGGTVLVETDPDPLADWRGTVRVRSAGGLGPATPWARLGAAALPEIGRAAGLTPVAARPGPRAFAELRLVEGSRTPSRWSAHPDQRPLPRVGA